MCLPQFSDAGAFKQNRARESLIFWQLSCSKNNSTTNTKTIFVKDITRWADEIWAWWRKASASRTGIEHRWMFARSIFEENILKFDAWNMTVHFMFPAFCNILLELTIFKPGRSSVTFETLFCVRGHVPLQAVHKVCAIRPSWARHAEYLKDCLQ